jgi:hypothetical protein
LVPKGLPHLHVVIVEWAAPSTSEVVGQVELVLEKLTEAVSLSTVATPVLDRPDKAW